MIYQAKFIYYNDSGMAMTLVMPFVIKLNIIFYGGLQVR